MLRPASHLRDTDPSAPHHLLLGPDTHGVTRYAGEVAGAARAPVVRDVAQLVPGAAVHLHLTDRLLAREPAEAAAAVEQLARRVRLTVTLHDVPQPTDGPVFAARALSPALRSPPHWPRRGPGRSPIAARRPRRTR